MGREEQFDSFYHATRHAMVHQAFALTGDLSAAQAAVRDAYVAAWHHWRKASAFDDPRDWVRPRAWQLAQRRHAARLRHRTKEVTPEQKAVLDALSDLSMSQRRTLLLTQLVGTSLPDAARELGLPQEIAERQLQAGMLKLATTLGDDAASIRDRLASLEDAVSESAFPRASIVRRAGQKRRRSHTVIAAAAAAFLSVAAGAFAYEPADVEVTGDVPIVEEEQAAQGSSASTAPSEEREKLPTAEQMLDRKQIARLGRGQRWRVTETHDNTSGSGIHTICQGARFADPHGLSAVVRMFAAKGSPRRSAVQTLEISKSPEQAADAYSTMIGWFAGCDEGQVQLLSTYRVKGVGDQATVMLVRSWSRPTTSYSVAITQVGQVVTSTVSKTRGTEFPGIAQVVRTLANSVSQVCERIDDNGCKGRPSFTTTLPPPSGDSKGMLAVVDLPNVGGVSEPWVGTKALPARPNPSATTCDRANFVKGGAKLTRTKTYLIPGSKLPDRFGLSETYGTFPKAVTANQFLAEVRGSFGDCEDRDLATDVTSARSGAPGGMDMSLWTFATEVSDSETVVFRVGFIRFGRHVAQLTFSPTVGADMSDEDFHSLVVRAGQRLQELG